MGLIPPSYSEVSIDDTQEHPSGVYLEKESLYLHRKLSIFLRKDRDCKAVNLYNSRKRYAVIESLDLMRNTPWLAGCFIKIKKPNKKFY